MIVRNRSPYGPRYRLVRSPAPEVYLTDVLIDIGVVWMHALRMCASFVLGLLLGAAGEARRQRRLRRKI